LGTTGHFNSIDANVLEKCIIMSLIIKLRFQI